MLLITHDSSDSPDQEPSEHNDNHQTNSQPTKSAKKSKKNQSVTPPKWYLWSVVALGIIGSLISFYATWHHVQFHKHGKTNAVCNVNDTVNCDTIAASAYSELFNTPLGVWGLGFFLALIALATILLPKSPLTRKVSTHVSALMLLTFVGMMTSLVLGFISTVQIKAFCLTCGAVYVTTFILGGLTIYLMKKHDWKLKLFQGVDGPWYGLVSAAIVLVITLAGYSQISQSKPDPSQFPDHPSQNEKKRQQNAMDSILSSKVFDIPLNLSPYSGLGEDYRKGSDQAPIVIVEFVDFECPACARLAP
ncbi:MAG: hypothetical protein OXC40_01520, partial [Proteobacteria bacterium]|nr:hypothetical protein [Pseudomonadota bacterium]